MNTKQLLNNWIENINVTRQKGNTKALIDGLANTEQKVHVVHANRMLGEQTSIVSWDNPESLRGTSSPIVFDNSAILNILTLAVDTITDLEKVSEDYSDKLSRIVDVITEDEQCDCSDENHSVIIKGALEEIGNYIEYLEQNQ